MSFKIVKVESIRREGLLIESIRHEWLKIVVALKSFATKALMTFRAKSIRDEWVYHEKHSSRMDRPFKCPRRMLYDPVVCSPSVL